MICLFNPFVNPGVVVRPIPQLRSPSPGEATLPEECKLIWHSISSPGQWGRELSARAVTCPGPHPILLYPSDWFLWAPHVSLAVQPEPHLGQGWPPPHPKCQTPEPIVPPSAAGRHHPSHFAHSEHMPPRPSFWAPGALEKNLPSSTLGNCLWGPGQPVPLQLGVGGGCHLN